MSQMSQISQMSSTNVLIVGAGPTGLAAASLLKKLNLSVRIVDKNHARSTTSKALGVQAGTLACLASALSEDLSKEMVSAGQPTRDAYIHLDDRAPIHANLSTIPSANNFILILAQSETERLLEEDGARRGVKIERGTEVLTVVQNSQQVTSRLRDASGKEEDVISDFVLGADGAHSIVRHQTGIEFQGDSYTGHFVLGDVKVEWPYSYDSIHVFANERGLIAAFPMKGEQRYRLMLVPKTIPPENESPDIDLAEYRKILASLSDEKIKVDAATWLTRFRVHHRLASHFQKGRIFLAGDAAHIHSPAGGQGMNTGIQDALNLSFKIKGVLDGRAPSESLENYERERRPVALNVVRSTDLVFKMALSHENAAIAFFRGHVLPKAASNAWIQKHVVAAISEMAVANREIAHYD